MEESLAQQAPRTDRNFRLRDLIALSQRIALGIEESQNTFLLVRLQSKPRNRKDENKTQNEGNQNCRSYPSHEQSNGNRRQKRKRSSQIRLQCDQSHRYETNDAGFPDLKERHVPAAAKFRQVSGQCDDDYELDQL